jgi:hypothetical protein
MKILSTIYCRACDLINVYLATRAAVFWVPMNDIVWKLTCSCSHTTDALQVVCQYVFFTAAAIAFASTIDANHCKFFGKDMRIVLPCPSRISRIFPLMSFASIPRCTVLHPFASRHVFVCLFCCLFCFRTRGCVRLMLCISCFQLPQGIAS